MSGQVTVIGGVTGDTLSGIVTVPASGLGNQQITNLQSVLDFLDTEAESHVISLSNYNAVTGTTASFAGTTSGGLFEITNADSLGNTVSGAAMSSVVSVPSGYQAVVVQVPGTVSVSGNGGTTSVYLLGSGSDVALSTNGSGSGTNTIVGTGGNDTITAAGDNVATLAGGTDVFRVLAGSDTIEATGSESVRVGVPTGYAGHVDFINSSSQAALVLGGAGAVTAFGGDAGGTYLGGTSGGNSLMGGNGAVFLVGGGNGDFLEAGGNGATSSSGTNYLFGGNSGNETLMATSVTGTNMLVAGTGTDIMSTEGSGTQYFFGGPATSTMTGSTTSGAFNVYYFGNPSAVGGTDIITNFDANNSVLNLTNGVTITGITSLGGTSSFPSGGTSVNLSDGTRVDLIGISQSAISINGSTIT